MKKIPLTLYLLTVALIPLCLFAQSDDSLLDADLDLDALFETPEVIITPQEIEEKVVVVEKEPDLPYSLSGKFSFKAGYGAEWSESDLSDMEQLAYIDLGSTLTLNFQLDDNFRVLQKYAITFDDFDFDAEISEFFCDFTIGDNLFTRTGRQTITWGTSRYFPFTNLPDRLPEDFSDTDSLALKLNVPVSMGGVELLALTREGYIEDTDSPKPDEIGYGGTFNLARPAFDLTVGTFYHSELNWRSFYSFNTTLFHRLELYQEGLFAYDIQGDEADSRDFALNLGLYMDFFDKALKVSAEYFYNGEETELDLDSTSSPLIWGHNFGGTAQYSRGKLHLTAQVKYGTSLNSGVFTPAVTFDYIPHLTLNMGCPILLGSMDEEGYGDLYDKRVTFAIAAVVSGKF